MQLAPTRSARDSVPRARRPSWAAAGRIAVEGAHRFLAQRVLVAGRHDHARITDDLGHRTGGRADARQTRRHRFQENDTEGFVARGHYEERCRAEQRRELLGAACGCARDRTGRLHAGQWRSGRQAAGDRQARRRNVFADRRERCEDLVAALAREVEADEERVRGSVVAAAREQFLVDVAAGADDLDALVRDRVVARDTLADPAAEGEDPRVLLEHARLVRDAPARIAGRDRLHARIVLERGDDVAVVIREQRQAEVRCEIAIGAELDDRVGPFGPVREARGERPFERARVGEAGVVARAPAPKRRMERLRARDGVRPARRLR